MLIVLAVDIKRKRISSVCPLIANSLMKECRHMQYNHLLFVSIKDFERSVRHYGNAFYFSHCKGGIAAIIPYNSLKMLLRLLGMLSEEVMSSLPNSQ